MDTARAPCPGDVSGGAWEFLLPCLTLVDEHAPQRDHDLREVFDALRDVVRTGGPWRMLPHDFPPWSAVYRQARRWMAAKVFEQIARELRIVLRLVDGRSRWP